MNQGTLQDPLTLSEALATTRIKPGHTVWLRGGVYSGEFAVGITGTAEAPITFRPYPGEIAIIDGSLLLQTAHVTWRDMIIRYSGWTTRETEIAGSAPPGMPLGKGVHLRGANTKLINCIIHDCSGGPATSIGAVGAEVYGCVIFNNGWSGPDRGHGHGFYVQSLSATPQLFRENIVFHHFSTGIKMYAEGVDLSGYRVTGNTCFCTGVPYALTPILNHKMWNIWAGGYLNQYDIEMRENMTWHRPGEGQPNDQGWGGGLRDLVVVDNYMPEGLTFHPDTTIAQNTGNYTGPGAGNAVFLRPNEYDLNRANLTIYNEAGADTVSVNVSSVFAPGDTLYLWSVIAGVDVNGIKQDRVAYTVAGDGTIAVDMRASEHPVAAPYQWAAPDTTFPTFGAFVVERNTG